MSLSHVRSLTFVGALAALSCVAVTRPAHAADSTTPAATPAAKCCPAPAGKAAGTAAAATDGLPACCVGGNCCAKGACCKMAGCCKGDGSCCDPANGKCKSDCGCLTAGCCAGKKSGKSAAK